jgi:hypothetical protein
MSARSIWSCASSRGLLALGLGLALLRPVCAQTTLIGGNEIVVGWQNYCATAGASGTTYACEFAPGTEPDLGVYVVGAAYRFKADVANTGAATINFSGLGAKALVKLQGGIATALVANDIKAGQIVVVVYDGTNMQVVSPLGLDTLTIASGTIALATAAIASGTCATPQTATATGTLSTDTVLASFNANVTGVTGYTPATTGTLRVDVFPSANTVTAIVCNATAASITPGSVTLNYRVVR